MSLLLAKAKYPDAPLDLQLYIGWLVLALLSLILLWVWTRSEPLRRAFFAREDPRLFGLFRIGLGLITIQNFWNLRMHWRMLWTDEGMFTGPEVRQRLGRAALKGWTETDGFLDGWAIAKFFWGKYSLLFIKSDPTFVVLYLSAFFLVLVLFTVGFRTRVTAVLAMVMMVSLYNRNTVYIEGHDTVFKCMWFFTIFARTDEAWSVDNWLRRKRERLLGTKVGGGRDPAAVPFDWLHFGDRVGHVVWASFWVWLFCAVVEFRTAWIFAAMLVPIAVFAAMGMAERDHRRGLAEQGKLELGEPIRFRLIPAWPRYLFIAQLVCIYSATGLYKTGPVWRRGDALYYALNMDHFYRFEGVTQWVSVYLGTNVFRFMSLVTWWWEKLFALVLIGLILRFREIHRDSDWYKEFEAAKWRKWLGGAALIAAYGVAYRIATVAYPWCLALQKDDSPTPAEPGLQVINIVMLAVIPACVIIYQLLGWRPIPVGKLFARLFRGRGAEAKIDQSFVRKWVFGRRIWIGVGILFHGMLLTTMNIGMFPVIMMWIYPAYFEAKPFLVIGRWTAAKLRSRKWTRWMAPAGLDEALSESPEVLESSADAVRRDPTGPWFLDPHKLIVGFGSLVRAGLGRETRYAAMVSTVERGRDRGGRIPDVVVLAICAVGVVLVTLRGLEAKTEDEGGSDTTRAEFVRNHNSQEAREKRQAEAEVRKERLDQLGDFAHWWVYAGLAFAAVSHFRRRPAKDCPDKSDTAGASEDPGEAEAEPEGESETETESKSKANKARPTFAEPQLIGGTLMRTIVLGFVVYHCAAVATRFTPRYSVTKVWRGEAQKVFGDWVRGTNQIQSWKMFAPNPPRRNTFMRTIVVDGNEDEPYQVGKDHYHNRPYVFWYNDRERKMHRRMVGKSKWYLKYWAGWQCRSWAEQNEGDMPEEIRVFKLKTPIPPPEEIAKTRRASNPRERTLYQDLIETHRCKDDMLTPEFKQRRGWPLTDEDKRRMEREAEQTERSDEVKRINWYGRDDWGGPDEEAEAEAKAEAQARAEARAAERRDARVQGRPLQGRTGSP